MMDDDIKVVDDQYDNNNNSNNGSLICPANVDTCWYYFVNSNNGEIPEGELNNQTFKIESSKTTSTMTWRIQARKIVTDTDENENETREVAIQIAMPIDYSKQVPRDQ